VLSRPESLNAEEIVRVIVSQQDPRTIEIRLCSDSVAAPERDPSLFARVIRWLSVNWDPSEAITTAESINPEIAKYLREGGGRFLRGSTFYEDLLKTICTINSSWGFTKNMVRLLVEDIGEGVFPEPHAILKCGVRGLGERARVGYRASVLMEATEYLIGRDLMDVRGNAREDMLTAEVLREIKELGPYAVAHLRVLLHDFSRLPVDSEVRAYARSTLNLSAADIAPEFASWGKYAFLGYKMARIIRRDNWIG
jgi:3-methyladenine DNA glycosylase/8-oxoguanine DNA glycosylase